MDDDLSNFSNVAVELVKNVGAIIKSRLWDQKTVETKESLVDFVTETDKEVEKILISGLQSNFPDHKFIGEESTNESNPAVLTDAPTWIIDPVDGTMNFVHCNPHVCVSVGLYINKEPHLGIIFIPMFDFLLTASKGAGAYLNGRQIHVSNCKELSGALVYLEGGSSLEEEKIRCVRENFKLLFPPAQGASGSAAYNMSMVAIGAGDAFLEYGCHAWDMAAGACIIKEAGGVMIDPAGGEFDIMSRRMICASSNELAQEIASKIVQFYPKRDDA